MTNIETTTKEQLVKSRIGQGKFREDLIRAWDGKCAVTGANVTKVLKASHIKPWRVSNNQERLDPNNGLLLSPTYDALFDQGLISFKNDGSVLISSLLPAEQFVLLSVSTSDILNKKLNDRQKAYLTYHRTANGF